MNARASLLLSLVLLTVVTGAIMGRYADRQFIWYGDYASAAFATTGLNHVRYGLSLTKGAMVRNGNLEPPAYPSFSFHHPPAMSLVLGAAYAVFGQAEAVGRSVLIFFSLLNIWLLYFAVRLFLNGRTALIATVIAAFLPAQIFFATSINHDPMTLTFILASLVAFAGWRKNPTNLRLAALSAIISLGTTVDWPAYYVAGILPAFHLVQSWIEKRKLTAADYSILYLPALAVLMFGLFVLHAFLVSPKDVTAFVDLALERSGLAAKVDYGAFSNLGLLERSSKRLVNLFTLPATALAFVACFMAMTKLTDPTKETRETTAFLLLLLIIGITHPLLFRHVVWVHEHLLYFMLPAIAVGGAVAVDWMFTGCTLRRAVLPAALLFSMFLALALFQTRDLFWYGKTQVVLDVAQNLRHLVPNNGYVVTNATTHPYNLTGISYYSERTVIPGVTQIDQLNGWRETLGVGTPVFCAIFTSEQEGSAELSRYLAERWRAAKFEWGSLYDLSTTAGKPAASDSSSLR